VTTWQNRPVAARQGAGVSAAAALQALAQGQLIPVDASNQPADHAPSSPASSQALIALPGSLTTPSDLAGAITFASDRNGPLNIFVQEAAATTAHLLISSSGNEATPVWSPDGSQLLFASDRDGDFEIYLRQANGAEQKLTDNDAQDFTLPGHLMARLMARLMAAAFFSPLTGAAAPTRPIP
jgi:hypothetical protein